MICVYSEFVRGCDIGVDEAGRGPVIGPLVVCALAIPNEDRELLAHIGADDSKKLSSSRREEVFMDIKSLSKSRGWGIGEVICSPQRVDIGIATTNLNALEVVLFAEAVRAAADPTSTCTILLDACDVNASRFGDNVASELGFDWRGCNIVSKHRMDADDIVVGAASIIAKFTRDSMIERLSEELEMNLGSGYPSDPITRDAVRELCLGDEPHDCLRWSWSTVRDVWTNGHQSPLPERGAGANHPAQSSLKDWN